MPADEGDHQTKPVIGIDHLASVALGQSIAFQNARRRFTEVVNKLTVDFIDGVALHWGDVGNLPHHSVGVEGDKQRETVVQPPFPLIGFRRSGPPHRLGGSADVNAGCVAL